MVYPSGAKAGPCAAQSIRADGIYSESDPVYLALRAFFARIYDQCGVSRPDRLDDMLKHTFGTRR
jgi:hypothetical protein